ncbi:hypothetical protein PAXRUDRAFT_10602 [Paxillus rubicundulus Ve08.2h10]|uniref:Uncharacterized protein n=1 Tax=Paxillus rubicundulus Ve08.2h10 TaxID=930991 RepID=A0A0D0E5S1_9AGAM|nr:hypothetical protein PAXRUDRAFT_10602 [Paxillus rubicundulus Ve08.2h10]
MVTSHSFIHIALSSPRSLPQPAAFSAAMELMGLRVNESRDLDIVACGQWWKSSVEGKKEERKASVLKTPMDTR